MQCFKGKNDAVNPDTLVAGWYEISWRNANTRQFGQHTPDTGCQMEPQTNMNRTQHSGGVGVSFRGTHRPVGRRSSRPVQIAIPSFTGFESRMQSHGGS